MSLIELPINALFLEAKKINFKINNFNIIFNIN